MATDESSHPDMLRLHAFVDGELTPTERAAVAEQIRAQPHVARAHATLARLKATIGESADAVHPPKIAPTRRTSHRAALGLSAAALAICGAILVSVFAASDFPAGHRSVARVGHDSVVTLAALPANPVIPNLDTGGLALEDVRVDRVGDVRLLVASYRGPHGCQLDLRVRPAGLEIAAGAGSSRHTWEVGPLAYELLAHGMPGWRFAIIADAAEHETRDGRAPNALRQRLREARLVAPPCTG
jgi:hypothetical protein